LAEWCIRIRSLRPALRRQDGDSGAGDDARGYLLWAGACTAPLTDEEIGGRYVHETGMAIVRRFAETAECAAIDPLGVPACLVAGHGPFAWGRNAQEAAHNAVVLEYIARMAHRTLTLKADADGVSQALLTGTTSASTAGASYGRLGEGRRVNDPARFYGLFTGWLCRFVKAANNAQIG